ncbi:PQQ-binding-like beta-propeller repeat protein [Anaerobaca lacustris]|uniref:PQQ-binding-like beta-propeller repeat protein n=1 Tax=Anaerobaca lacustris TaxID=3044600 RepID=A0AAW6TXI1_9BACT|nr:PQQ-binding-like beta-propeller repeat protein [Sedimentisphaerales bacterium M17dextr]
MTNAGWGIVSVAVVLLCLQVGLAGPWPNWRGPHFNGSADERGLPESWTDTENVLWTAALPGPAASTPAVCDGKVFVSSEVKGSDDLVALCFDVRTGRQLWSATVGRSDRSFPRNNLATPSPTTDGRHAFFLYGSGDLAALDFDGNIVWSRNIEAEYGNITCQFGYGASPVAFEGRLYIPILRRDRAWREPREGEPFDSFLLAVDPATGKTLWRHVRASDAQDESLDSYATPIPFRNGGRTEIVLVGGDYVTAHDPETGRELWRYCYATDRRDTRWRLIPSVVTGAGMVFGVQPRGGNDLFAIRADGADGVLSQDRIAWMFDRMTPDVPTPLFYQGRLYVLDGTRNGKVVTRLDPTTGRVEWHGRIGGGGPWRASLTAADGKLYCINEDSEVIVLSAGDEFRILHRFDMNDKPVQASIAIAEARLFLRTASKLTCIGKKEGRGSAD